MASSAADWASLDAAGLRHRAADPFSVGGLLVAFGVVVSLGTAREVLLAAALLAVAVFLPSTLAFVAGQLAVASAATLADGVAVALAQAALLVVLTEPARGRSVPVALGGTLVAYVALLGVVAVGLREGLIAAAGLLCLAVAVGTYLARRVTLVRLGQVEAEAKE